MALERQPQSGEAGDRRTVPGLSQNHRVVTASRISSASATSTIRRLAVTVMTRPRAHSRSAGFARRARHCGRPASPGTSPSTSSIRTMSCMSIPICRIRLFKAAQASCRSRARRPTGFIRKNGTTCPCRQRAGNRSTRPVVRARSRSTRGCRTFWLAPGRTKTAAGAYLRNYYYNCIRDCDRQVSRVLESLKSSGVDKNTTSCSRPTTANSVATTRCAARAIARTASRTMCR